MKEIIQLTSGYITKEVFFKFRGIDFTFALSQGLFSSADIDSGTRLLLKVLSRIMDEDTGLPRRVLDAGCGVGVIGICAAAALMAMEREKTAADAEPPSAAGQVLVRAQDRDELARLLTVYNAEKNHIPPAMLEAHTEPLLAGPENARWDLILTNIPAKAGSPVLEDFVRRSAGLLNSGGKVIMVAVHTLADFFRERIKSAGTELVLEEKSAGYSVFVYGGKCTAAAVKAGIGFLKNHPFYARTTVHCQIEEIPLRLETIHGASGFDTPGGAVLAAAKLIRRPGIQKLCLDGPVSHNAPILIHEPGQGFFPCWLLEYLRRQGQRPSILVLSGRNILALEAARHNAESALVVSAADLRIGGEALLAASAGQKYGLFTAFPELLPQSSLPGGADQLAAVWDSLTPLLVTGGVFIAAFSSADSERFDRKKPAGFNRLGELKRRDFGRWVMFVNGNVSRSPG